MTLLFRLNGCCQLMCYAVSVPLLFIYPSDVTEWISPSLGIVAVGAISVPYSEGGLRAIQD